MPFSLTGNDVRGPLRWIYAIGAPPDPAEDAPLVERERARIGKLTSLALCIELIEMGIAGYSTTEDPNKYLPFAYLGIVLSLLLGLLLNRYGRIKTAGVLAVGMIEIGMILTIIALPNQQLSSFNLPIFGLFIQPLLIAASLFPIWLVFPLALYHIAWIVLTITFMSKTPELIQHIQKMPYTAYGIPITLQVITMLVSFVWVRSAYEEMRRAETAQEVNRLTRELAENALQVAARQQELERNIEAIRSTLVNISNGNYQQPVPLTQGDILWPIALSLNTLMKRTRGFQQQGTRFEQVNTLLSELANELHLHRTGRKPLRLAAPHTGTAFDLVATELRSLLLKPGAESAHMPPR